MSSLSCLQQLSTLLQAGLPLLSAIDVLLAQPQQAKHWQPVKERLEAGSPLSAALTAWSDISSRDGALLEMAEHTGQLTQQLQKLVSQKQRQQTLAAAVKRALRYPLIVLSAALLLSAYLLTSVVPSFAQLYAGVDANLPALTQQVLALSEFVQTHGVWLLVLSLLVVATLMLSYQRLPRCRRAVHKLLWRMPLAQRIYRSQQWQHWHQQLADGLNAGIPLLHVMQLMQHSLTDSPLLRPHQRIIEAITQGQRIASVMDNQHFPLTARQLIHIGEESGMLCSLLTHLAEQFEQELTAQCQQVLQWLEPLLMVLLGLMIGTLVLALYLPLFELGSVMA